MKKKQRVDLTAQRNTFMKNSFKKNRQIKIEKIEKNRQTDFFLTFLPILSVECSRFSPLNLVKPIPEVFYLYYYYYYYN